MIIHESDRKTQYTFITKNHIPLWWFYTKKPVVKYSKSPKKNAVRRTLTAFYQLEIRALIGLFDQIKVNIGIAVFY